MRKLTLGCVLFASILSLSCEKEDENNNNNNTTTSSTTSTTSSTTSTSSNSSSYYFSATIDGKSVSLSDASSGYEVTLGSSSSGGYFHYEEQYSYFLNSYETPTNSGGIEICKIFSYSETENGNYPSCTQIKAMFKTGSYTFSKGDSDGVKVIYYDENGTLWSSALGTAEQTGSVFTVSDHSTTAYGAVTTATFNCKLYDGNGNSKTLTNGKFKSYTVTCY